MHAEAQRPSQTKFPRAGSHGYATNGEIARSRPGPGGVEEQDAGLGQGRMRRCSLKWHARGGAACSGAQWKIIKKGMHTYGRTQ